MIKGDHGIWIKNETEMKLMKEGGEILRKVKEAVKKEVKIGVNAEDLDKLAEKLIKENGAEPSFKLVPDYYWTTCINVNEGIVHGIPKKDLVFKKGDLVSVDLGVYYKGFHTDTSFSVTLEAEPDVNKFLETGKVALKKAIDKVRSDNYIYDISREIDETITEAGYSPVKALVGHGVGKELHEEPQIPCFVDGVREKTPLIKEGFVLAIEVMYAQGSPELVLENDGWTIATEDGKISALFEETVEVTKNGPLVIT